MTVEVYHDRKGIKKTQSQRVAANVDYTNGRE